jgi:4'-phosphopantetheinyl transferase
MIDWLVQSDTAHPDLARGVAPAGLLSRQEQARLASLRTEKRRRDWLLGRWTAKHLLRAAIERRTGRRIPLDRLIVVNDPDGAPRITGDWIPALSVAEGLEIGDSDSNLQSLISNLQMLSLSISHCRGRALCALAENGPVGADIERVEPRARQFVEDYFTGEEIALVDQASEAEYDLLVTAIWSAKEAALKTLRLGLTVDTRAVSCAIRPAPVSSGWGRFSIRCDPRLLANGDIPPLTGWWYTIGYDVLTLVTTAAAEHPHPVTSSKGHLS